MHMKRHLYVLRLKIVQYKTDMALIMAPITAFPYSDAVPQAKHVKHQHCAVILLYSTTNGSLDIYLLTLQPPVGANTGLVSSHWSAGTMIQYSPTDTAYAEHDVQPCVGWRCIWRR